MAESADRYPEAGLRRFAADVFRRAGLPPGDARRVADALLFASLRGQDTHGLVRVPAYLDRLRRGLVNPRPEIRIASPLPFSAVVDADNAMGPVAAGAGLEACLQRCRDLGVGAATVRRSNHFGAAAAYAEPAAARGAIGIVASPASASLAPYGGRAAFFGTNPLAVAVPAGRYGTWCMDMSASVVSRGRVRAAARAGTPLPEGVALDAEGRPTTEAGAALEGLLLPFGGAKGSALAMLVEILGGVLAGAAFGGEIRDSNTDHTAPSGIGHFLLAMRVEAFMPLPEFEARMETDIARLKALPTAAGVGEVLFPGERSARTAEDRRARGVPLDRQTVAALRSAADEHGAAFPEALGDASDPATG